MRCTTDALTDCILIRRKRQRNGRLLFLSPSARLNFHRVAFSASPITPLSE